jgi:hypothetical protein
MELILKAKILIDQLENLKENEMHFEVGPSNFDGTKSHEFQLYIKSTHPTNDGFLMVVLNKNHALYLCKALEAFVNEQDIDIKDED